jgi:hypothetical protein
MRKKKPYHALLDDVTISRNGDMAIITYHDPDVMITHFKPGGNIKKLTDGQILDQFNQTIAARNMLAAAYEHVAVEIPPGRPQIEYFEAGDQWTPRGDVLRCIVAGDGRNEDDVFVHIDENELSLREFGKLLSTCSGWGMRLIFVPEDELEKTPAIEVREPDKD